MFVQYGQMIYRQENFVYRTLIYDDKDDDDDDNDDDDDINNQNT